MTKALEHVLERTIVISARRATVFRYFTDSERFASWWGAGSHIEGRPGGRVHIRYPNGIIATGEVLEIAKDERLVFTYGYEDPSRPVRPGGSRVTLTLEDAPQGTRLHLQHEFQDASARDLHVQGWRYQMAVFSNVVANEQHNGAAEKIDGYFALWGEPDERTRHEGLRAIATEDVSFRDMFSCTLGPKDLSDHLAAAQAHMPGFRLKRLGDVRHCQGTFLAEWAALAPDGQQKSGGWNVFDMSADGRIARVVGFWRP